MTKKEVKNILYWVIIIGGVYLFIASTVYRFRHPDQSETELFLNLLKALMFRK